MVMGNVVGGVAEWNKTIEKLIIIVPPIIKLFDLLLSLMNHIFNLVSTKKIK